ncbi:hypothetical protein R1sor_004616 [Riccia sorocarpa]|uniref:non-specific serine/threonine protein kinase n=1 Tax=Riccia sorocarpa TaxID=122646 RepID=A0ABD3HLJ8_9MARC
MPPHAEEESVVGLINVAAANFKEDEDTYVTAKKLKEDLQEEKEKEGEELKRNTGWTVDDFRPIQPLGNGDMGTVFLVVEKGTDTPFALKVMKKEVLRVRKNVHRAQNEREILSKIDHPFLPKLHAHFENDRHSFLLLDYCHGGDLNILRQKQPEKRFSESACRFYVAEVLLALEYLHKRNIVYRDLKPENILIQDGGHIMLTDFDLSLDLSGRNWTAKPASAGRGTLKDFVHREDKTNPIKNVKSFFSCASPMALAKTPSTKKKNPKSRVTPEEMYRKAGSGKRTSDGPAHSFVGTEEYVAPEIVWGKGHGLPVDWWTLGVLLYELFYGKTPFKGVNRKETFYNVLCKRADFPGPQSNLTDLMDKLLQKEPEKRLGTNGGAEEIKRHPFFRGVDWENLQLVSRTPVVPSPFNLEEVELERKKKLEAVGKGDQKEEWSFMQQKSEDERPLGPIQLKGGVGEKQKLDSNLKLDITISKSGEYTFGSDDSNRSTVGGEVVGKNERRSDAQQSSSNRKEEVRLSSEETEFVVQKVFDEVF